MAKAIKSKSIENRKYEKIKKELFKRKDVKGLLKMQNVLSLKRINYPDHGLNHVRIVANNSIKIYELLKKAGIKTTTEKHQRFNEEEVKIILLLSSILHDVGMSVDREFHEIFSVIIAKDIVWSILKKYYSEEKAILMQSEILHCIFSHRRRGNPKTLEAQIVRLADGLDIAKGRSRMLLKENETNIHFVSSFSIDNIYIKEGKEKSVEIDVIMNNPAGLFLVSEFLKEKIKNTELDKHILLRARIKGSKRVYLV